MVPWDVSSVPLVLSLMSTIHFTETRLRRANALRTYDGTSDKSLGTAEPFLGSTAISYSGGRRNFILFIWLHAVRREKAKIVGDEKGSENEQCPGSEA